MTNALRVRVRVFPPALIFSVGRLLFSSSFNLFSDLRSSRAYIKDGQVFIVDGGPGHINNMQVRLQLISLGIERA